MEAYNTWSSVIGIFHLIFSMCSMYQYLTHFYCWIMFYCMDIPHYLSVYQLVDIWIVSTFCLLWNNAMNICVLVFVDVYVFSSLGYKTSGNLCLTFWVTDSLFSKVAGLFYIPISKVWGFQLRHIFTNICYLPF